MKGTAPLYNQSYIDTGKGPVVILLHGLFGRLNIWQKTIDALKKNHRIIVPRLPIFNAPEHYIDLPYLTHVLNEFLECKNLHDVTLIGHEGAGHLALLYAYRYPAQVDKIVIVGANIIQAHPGVFEQTESEVYERNEVNHISSAISLEKDEVLKKSQILLEKAEISDYSFHKLDHPVLLLWGTDDKITPPETAIILRDILPNSEIKFIDGCGHLPMTEQPVSFNYHLLGFLYKSHIRGIGKAV